MSNQPSTPLGLVALIVSAYVRNNKVETQALPGLIQEICQTMTYLHMNPGAGESSVESAKQMPAVPPKKSVFADYIICLEDGKKLKMLKRHLNSAYGLTPDAYRQKWGLPDTYPMVAPNYAERRSTLARAIGLGRKAIAAGNEGEPVATRRRRIAAE
ncbi:MucR family transcriptional regulator [Lichenicoccus roseus]|uniref:MucR family transcriptional regulator n=1 Tax=Lichenicoccus roseus TaxID=2683649 RepID=A0A5R9J3W0_9PROT|nr:MucR family transcriptional regulator [Lichenicoccus roseus]TLU71187.1 MucR family transcriptional regulator [Lichenicoccus roseus]